MTIKTTLFQLENTLKHFNVLTKCEMSGVTGRKVIKIGQEISSEIEILNKSKEKLIEKYKDFKIEKDGELSFGEKQDEVNKEYVDLLNSVVELKSEALTEKDIDSITKICPEVLGNLSFLLEQNAE